MCVIKDALLIPPTMTVISFNIASLPKPLIISTTTTNKNIISVFFLLETYYFPVSNSIQVMLSPYTLQVLDMRQLNVSEQNAKHLTVKITEIFNV